MLETDYSVPLGIPFSFLSTPAFGPAPKNAASRGVSSAKS
jgi:hypothetical protein